MIIDKNSDGIKLKKVFGKYQYVYRDPIETYEDILINLDYPIYFENWITTKRRIQSNVTIEAYGDIISEYDIDVAGCIIAGGGIVAGADIVADDDITAKEYIEFGSYINAGGDITAGGRIGNSDILWRKERKYEENM